MFRPHRNEALMLILTAISLFCLMVLAGLFVYSGGSLLPSTLGAGVGETAQIWIMWGIVVAVPLVTAMLWVMRRRKRRK
jgi:hypothetical protein